MPFKSEAQRRYLWANEPEIARDWTDTYGSRIQKSNGGIMDVASDGELIDRFKNYKKGKQVTVPTSFQARSHSTPVNLAYITDEEAGILKALKPGVPHDGPMHIPNYNDYDPDRGFTSGAAMSAMESGSTNARDRAEVKASNYGAPSGAGPGVKSKAEQDLRSSIIAAGAGQNVNPGWFGPRNRVSKEELARAKAFAPQAYRATRGSRFGIGNLIGGLAGLVMGIPGLGLGINALRSLPKHDTLSDWWGSRKTWRDDDKEEIVLSNFQRNPVTGKYEYVERVNPEYHNDLGNEEMFATDLPENMKALNEYTMGSIPFNPGMTVGYGTGIEKIDPSVTQSYTSASDLPEEFQDLATHAKVTKQDLARYTPRTQKNLIDAQTYQSALDSGTINPNMTEFEFNKMREGLITQPGTYTEEDFA